MESTRTTLQQLCIYATGEKSSRTGLRNQLVKCITRPLALDLRKCPDDQQASIFDRWPSPDFNVPQACTALFSVWKQPVQVHMVQQLHDRGLSVVHPESHNMTRILSARLLRPQNWMLSRTKTLVIYRSAWLSHRIVYGHRTFKWFFHTNFVIFLLLKRLLYEK